MKSFFGPLRKNRQGERRRLMGEPLEHRCLLAVDLNPLHNYAFPSDVNDDGELTPLDALCVINTLNAEGAAREGEPGGALFFDVSDDGATTPLDALIVINRLNDPEGENGLLARFTFDATDLAGNVITSVGKNNRFFLNTYIQDLRTTSPNNQFGAFTAYLDVLYDSQRVGVDLRESQSLTFSTTTTGGNFTLTFDGQKTANIPFVTQILVPPLPPIDDPKVVGQVNAAAIKSALEALPNIDPGDVDVQPFVPVNVPDAPGPLYKYDVKFGGRYANQDVPLLTGDGSGLTPAGTASLLVESAYGPVPTAAAVFRRSVTFGFPKYTDRDRAKDAVGMIDEVGAQSDALFGGLGKTRNQVFKVEMTALAKGTATFGGDAAEDPGNTVLLFGMERALTTSEYGITPLNLTIIEDITANNDSATVNEDSSFANAPNLIDVLFNDTVTVGTKNLESFTDPPHGSTELDNGGTPTIFSDDKIRYKPDADYFGADSFTYVINNGLGAKSSATVNIIVTGVNDGPTNTAPTTAATNEDVVLVFANKAIQVADKDADAAVTNPGVEVNLVATRGKLEPTASSATITGSGTKNVTIKGLVAAVNAALDGLKYTPDKDYFGADTLAVNTTDLGNTGTGGEIKASSNIAITINAVNDPPQNQVPGAQTAFINTPLVFSPGNANGLSVIDPDADSTPFQVTLAVPQNSGTLAATGITPSAQIVLQGTLANINSTLASGVTYNPALNFVGTIDLTMTSSDGALQDVDKIPINVAPPVRPWAINDQGSMSEDGGSLKLNVLSNDLPHVGSQATLISFDQPNPGTGSVALDNNNTPADLTDDTLVFTPAAFFNGNTQFKYKMNDTLPANDPNKGQDAEGTVVITVSPVNNPPVLNVPGQQTILEDTKLPFGAAAFSLSDVDAGAGTIKAILSVTNGTLNVTPDGANVQGNGSKMVTILGTVTAVDSALDKVEYTPTKDFNGSDTLKIDVDDQGNTGPTVEKVSKTVGITITPVNDPPQNTVPPDQKQFITNFPNELSQAAGNAIQVSDVDSGSANIQVDLSVTGGQFQVRDTSLVQVTNNNSSNVRLLGNLANINETLARGVIYRHNVEGTFTATLSTSDLGNTGSGGIGTDTDQFKITVINFVPSTLGGRVFFDPNKSGAFDPASEVGIAGVQVKLTGTTFLGEVIKDGDVVATTDRDGNYRFTNVKPGKYTIEQVQPGRSLDGADTPEAPVTNKVVNNTVVNDQFYVDIGVHPVTGVLGGLTSLNNNYAELGLLPGAGYPSVFQLLASSGGQPGGYESWILFGMNTAPWQAYSPAGWKSYSNASLGSIVRDAQGKVTSAVLKVRDDGTGAFKEKTVTTASGRLRVSADQQIFTIMGSASDMFAAAGEGEQSGGAAMDAYRRGVDAVFAEAGSGSSEIA